jgi:hypothetical protein
MRAVQVAASPQPLHVRLRPTVLTRAGVCLIMADIEALPSNTG